MLLVSLMTAFAGEVEVWSYDFTDAEQMGGTDGWENGYRDDPWYGFDGENHNYAGPYTDDGQGCDNGWSEDCNNYLVHGAEEVFNGRYQAGMYTQDDDTIGLVFGFKAPDDYLVFVLCGADDNASCPLGEVTGQAAILHVTGRGAEVLGSGGGGYAQEEFLDGVEVSVTNGEITASAPNVRPISATMPDDRPMNGVGFYAYNSGAAQGTYVLFYEPALFALDTDDDGVIDDIDNCVDVANPDQTDEDGDGIGAECDDNDGGGGSGDDTGNGGGGDDSGNGNGGDDSGDPTDPGGNGGTTELTAPGGCACDAGGLAPAGAALIGGLALVVARRKRTE